MSPLQTGSVVLRDVPSHSTVVGIPGRIVKRNNLDNSLNHNSLPDIEALAIRALFDRVKELETQIKEVKERNLVPVNSHRFNHTKPRDLSASDLLIEDFLDGAGI